MSVRKRGDRWQVRLRLGGGRRVERALPKGGTRADALAVESQIRRAQIDAAAGRKPDVALDTLLDRWINEQARRQRSWSRTKYIVSVLREFTAGRTLVQIQDVAGKVRSADAMPATINRYLSVLRRIANLAEEWGLIERAPKIKLLTEHNERHVYLTPHEVSLIAGKCSPEVGDFVRMLALTGLRRGELLGLGVAAVRGGAIMLDARTKTGKPRSVPLSPEALRIAQERLPWRPTVWDIRREFGAARASCGLPQVRLHDLRHTFASFLVQSGQSMKVVKELLGHTTMAMTDRYAHLADDHLRRAVAGLPVINVSQPSPPETSTVNKTTSENGDKKKSRKRANAP